MKRKSSKSPATKRPLALNKETICTLQTEQLSGVAGAGTFVKSVCFCPI